MTVDPLAPQLIQKSVTWDSKPLSATGCWIFSQNMRFGSNISTTSTLRTGVPQGCVFSPLLFTLLTHDCVSTFSSNHIIKFAENTTVVGFITYDEASYRKEVCQLPQ